MPDGRATERKQQPARNFLKTATDAIHDEAHQLPLMQRLADGTISRADYKTLTQRLYHYYFLVDQRLLAGCAETGIDLATYTYEPRTPMIAQDLQAMHEACPPPRPNPHGLPELPPLWTRPSIAGAAYVVEGSLMGAKLLERALPEAVAAPQARTFWRWCASVGSGRWAMTRSFIENACPDAASRNEARAAALVTFKLFHALLDPARAPALNHDR